MNERYHLEIIPFNHISQKIIDNPEWGKYFTPVTAHSRKINYIASRMALHLALESFDYHIPAYDIQYREGKWNLPFHSSISHTQNYAAAVISPYEHKCHVGLDIETKTRVLPPDVQTKIKSCAKESADSLITWTQIEAGYKLLNQLHPQIKHPLQLRVVEDRVEFEGDEKIYCHWKQMPHPELLITLAFSLF